MHLCRTSAHISTGTRRTHQLSAPTSKSISRGSAVLLTSGEFSSRQHSQGLYSTCLLARLYCILHVPEPLPVLHFQALPVCTSILNAHGHLKWNYYRCSHGMMLFAITLLNMLCNSLHNHPTLNKCCHLPHHHSLCSVPPKTQTCMHKNTPRASTVQHH